MLAFVLLAGEHGQPVDPAISDRLLRNGPAELPFVCERVLRWSNPSGSVQVVGWEAFPEMAGAGSQWQAAPDGLTVFTGHCWPSGTGWTDPTRTWADQLAEWPAGRNPETARDELFGHFTILRLDAEGRGTIVTDVLSSGPVYTAATPGCTVIASRASLAALAVTLEGEHPTRSPMAAGWLVFNTVILDEETGYIAVEHLPFGSSMRIDPEHGTQVEAAARSPLIPPPDDPMPATYPELTRLMVEEVRSHLTILDRLPVDSIELRLSGGKDSRLLAAGIVATGLQDRIRVMSFGPPEKSDPLAAAAVARAFDLDWRLEDRRGRPAQEDLDLIATHTFLTEGAISGWNTTSALVPRNTITITGVGGDYIGWRAESAEGLTATSRALVLEQFRARKEFDRFALLQPEARAWYHDEIERWVDERLDSGIDPIDLRALFLRETKMRGAVGPARLVGADLWVDSFATALWYRAGFRLPPAQRPGFRFHVDVLELLCPEMLFIPLADKAWTPDSYQHRPDRTRFEQLAPIVGTGGEASNWRVVGWETYRPLIAELLLDRSNPLYNVLDYRRVERLMRRPTVSAGHMRVLYAALTGALWLGGHEHRRQISRTA